MGIVNDFKAGLEDLAFKRQWYRTALIDGDILVYRIGFACENEDEVTTLKTISKSISNIINIVEAIDSNIYLTGSNNFRDKLATIRPYKGNRAGLRKPRHYNFIRDCLIQHYNSIVTDGIEADDAIGIAAYRDWKIQRGTDTNTVICTMDKDLNMIPGWHYKPFQAAQNALGDEIRGIDIVGYWVDEKSALKSFYTQLLTGDKVDNIQGVPGIGPGKAAKILSGVNDEESMFWECFKTYESYYLGGALEALVENARLLWILRHENEVWKPPV